MRRNRELFIRLFIESFHTQMSSLDAATYSNRYRPLFRPLFRPHQQLGRIWPLLAPQPSILTSLRCFLASSPSQCPCSGKRSRWSPRRRHLQNHQSFQIRRHALPVAFQIMKPGLLRNSSVFQASRYFTTLRESGLGGGNSDLGWKITGDGLLRSYRSARDVSSATCLRSLTTSSLPQLQEVLPGIWRKSTRSWFEISLHILS